MAGTVAAAMPNAPDSRADHSRHAVFVLLAGGVIIENVFSLPGLGRLVFQAIVQRDLIVVQSVVVILVHGRRDGDFRGRSLLRARQSAPRGEGVP